MIKKAFENKRLILYVLYGSVLVVCTAFLVHNIYKANTARKAREQTIVPIDLTLAQFSDRKVSSSAIETPETQNKTTTPQNISPSPSPLAKPKAVVKEGCSLKVLYSVSTTKPAAGDKINYGVTIKNEGNTTCKNPSISVYYSDEENYLDASPKPTASNYYWQIQSLSPNHSQNISFTTIQNGSAEENRYDTQGCATAENANEDACVSFRDTQQESR